MSRHRAKKATVNAPAFYAQPGFLTRRAARDWWTLLHPPYTAWHLSYVVIGACLAGPVNAVRLLYTMAAFFLAVGIGAHALDELQGRPLATAIPAWQLVAASVIGLGGAVGIGVAGLFVVGPYLALFIVAGVTVALGYNLELFGGRLHTDPIFAIGWGAFPLLSAYFAQHARLSVASLLAALFATLLSQAQRQLSSPARDLRRRTSAVHGTLTRIDGSTQSINKGTLLTPLELALRSLCATVVTLAIALAWVQFHLR